MVQEQEEAWVLGKREEAQVLGKREEARVLPRRCTAGAGGTRGVQQEQVVYPGGVGWSMYTG